MTYGEIFFFLISKTTLFFFVVNFTEKKSLGICLGSYFLGFVLFHLQVNVGDKYVSNKQLNLQSTVYKGEHLSSAQSNRNTRTDDSHEAVVLSSFSEEFETDSDT